ncbi:MAG: Holliday junction resolvase RecU [Bacilli bacterium]|nr:Holliday junction resolvase RecU [Bacilli bacterium]
MIKYPNGTKYQPSIEKKRASKKSKEDLSISASNRGMDLESDINLSNEWYRDQDIAVITKRPTPINIVKVDYTHGARITDAYFEKQSTTDYNGVYKGRYIDFEAKNTKSKTSFPLSNIEKHQIEHLKRVIRHGGIAFFIIQFQTRQEVYLLDASFVIDFYENGERKSIPYEVFVKDGILIKQGYSPRLYYIDAIEQQYFKK